MQGNEASVPLLWPRRLDRQAGVRKVYLDLNHWIGLARVAQGLVAASGYADLYAIAQQAVADGRTIFPLSGTHYLELSAIRDPRQREQLATVMDELSNFRVLLGRVEIMRLEVREALDSALGASGDPDQLPLLGNSFAYAFGRSGKLSIRTQSGEDVTDSMQDTPGYRRLARRAEHRILAGPSDSEALLLRETTNYRPETAGEHARRRAEQEQEHVDRLNAMTHLRTSRLRDVTAARELALEWIDVITDELGRRGYTIGGIFGDYDKISRFADGMPSNRVAISIKTHYHRNPQRRWTPNDIADIDALSIAVPYCDAVLTDKAARDAVVRQRLDEQMSTFMPRRPADLAEWLT